MQNKSVQNNSNTYVKVQRYATPTMDFHTHTHTHSLTNPSTYTSQPLKVIIEHHNFTIFILKRIFSTGGDWPTDPSVRTYRLLTRTTFHCHLECVSATTSDMQKETAYCNVNDCICTHVRTQVFMYVFTYVCMYVCMYACVYVCVCVYVCCLYVLQWHSDIAPLFVTAIWYSLYHSPVPYLCFRHQVDR